MISIIGCFVCVYLFKGFYEIMFNFYLIYVIDFQLILNFIENIFLYLVK